jgi:addiction module RelE/StbE family toxin
MRYEYDKGFIKRFRKLEKPVQRRVRNAIDLFKIAPETASLRNHKLSGKLRGTWSISAGGDIRIHYKKYRNGDIVIIFVAVGTHSQLY